MNFSTLWEMCQRFAKAGDFDCFLLAGRYTLLEQSALDEFLPLCVEKNIGILLGGPYNSSILATGALEGAKYDYKSAPPEIVDKVRRIEAVCERHNVPLLAAAIQFPLAHPAIASIIPGAANPSEVRRNVELMSHPKRPVAGAKGGEVVAFRRADALSREPEQLRYSKRSQKNCHMKIFVPGRLCLFGEHSDWAGGYRRINSALEKGYTLLVGTNQGLYAQVKPHPTQLILRASLSDGTRKEPLVLPMDRKILLAEAEKGGFFSYAAGVAYQFLTHFRVRGLEIDNYLTDLPIEKGLSSSAALCVLVARAFNRVYDLKMTIRGEMELAYQGEITTPSRCGRMDQACAYGNRPILMSFDGDRTDVIELNVAKDLFFVIVDLGAGKNTQEILSQLNQCYPFAANEVHRNVQQYLGSISAQITQEAVEALQKGDAERLGSLMKSAQAEFDRYLMPACPSQLTAPVLHQVLNYQPIQPYILGGKGVGSQGDGTAQFIVKDEASQQKVIEIIERDFPKMQSLKLTIHAKRKVRKAVIPAAGFGTRLFPATKVVKKELFPIIDRDGRAKPVIMAIVEEAISAGIEEIGIVVQSGDRALFEDFFKAPPTKELFNKLSPQNQEYSQYLQDLGSRITILTQDEQEGYGHAVFCAREWVKDEPFLLMLGDHVYSSDTASSCARQVLDVYEQVNQSVVGLTVMPAEIIHKAGCVTGTRQESDNLLCVTQLYEKPDIEYARKHLRVEGMADNQFLCIFGLYVLKSKIFDYLEEHISHNIREQGEFQLTSCLDKLRQEEGVTGYIVKGRCFDTGLPDVYRQTMIDFPKAF